MLTDVKALIKPGMGFRVMDGFGEFEYDYWNGRLLMWEAPIKGEEYCLGVDSSEGVGQDRSVCEVIRKGTLLKPDEQVAEFACDFMDPVDFAASVNAIGRLYSDSEGNEAFCTIETNNPAGSSILNTLRTRWDYSNLFNRKDYEKRENLFTTKLGWHTTRHNRGIIIARGLHALQYGDLIVNSRFLVEEMADFESNFDIAAAKAKSRMGHDDRVMAFLIGYFGGHDDEWLAGDDIAEERRLYLQAQQQADRIQQQINQPVVPKMRDYQSSPISYREMMERVDDWLLDD